MAFNSRRNSSWSSVRGVLIMGVVASWMLLLCFSGLAVAQTDSAPFNCERIVSGVGADFQAAPHPTTGEMHVVTKGRVCPGRFPVVSDVPLISVGELKFFDCGPLSSVDMILAPDTVTAGCESDGSGSDSSADSASTASLDASIIVG